MAKSPGIVDTGFLGHAAHGPPEAAAGVVARFLDELVRYYRHSAVGRRCTGVIHNMNTPLQVISFQLELLEQKTKEEAELLSELVNPSAPHLQALHEYRDQKLKQLHQEVDKLREMIHRLALQAIHEGKKSFVFLI